MNYEHVTFDYEKQEILSLLPKIIESNPEFAKYVFNCGPKYSKIIGAILGLKHVDGILYFRMPAHFKSQVHIDMNSATGQVRTFALNLPLTTCDKVVMKWYDKKEGSDEDTILGAHMTSFPVLSDEDSICNSIGELNKPMIAQIHPWHNVENFSGNDFDERFISIRFRRDLKEYDILEMIKRE
jgi:hypothetical protein